MKSIFTPSETQQLKIEKEIMTDFSVSSHVKKVMDNNGFLLSVLHYSSKLGENKDSRGVFELFSRLKYQ